MKYKTFTIISILVLVVAGCSTLFTSKMIVKGITDNILCSKVYTILVISGFLTIIALICIGMRAMWLLHEHLNKWAIIGDLWDNLSGEIEVVSPWSITEDNHFQGLLGWTISSKSSFFCWLAFERICFLTVPVSNARVATLRSRVLLLLVCSAGCLCTSNLHCKEDEQFRKYSRSSRGDCYALPLVLL